MARYRGRHRAPSTTGRTLARTAVAGAVAGAPLLVTVPAQAAPDSVWDRLAMCESSGNWAINTGNGFSGGLQFTPSTWRAFGGALYAPMAYQASREQQIVIAERVLAGQGWGAWPACSRKLGITGVAATPRPAVPAKPAAGNPAPAPGGGGGSYVVKRGDSLSSIAAAHRVAGGWKALAAKNHLANPNRLSVGQRLVL